MKDKLMNYVPMILNNDLIALKQALVNDPTLLNYQASAGASRENADDYFYPSINRYVYQGDTLLHIAAAAFQSEIVAFLLESGADVHLKNRLGAQCLHYGADNHHNLHLTAENQTKTLKTILDFNADPNAFDKNGVAPLHRAVRTRAYHACGVLIDGGADPLLANRRGSTPLHLAVQTTGRGYQDLDAAHHSQALIIELLVANGAQFTDCDAKGISVKTLIQSDWIKQRFLPDAD